MKNLNLRLNLINPTFHVLQNGNGFTLIELLFSILLTTLLIFFLAGCIRENFSAYHSETIANLKVVQAALERYASDHDGEYPQFILGGNKDGWLGGNEAIKNRPPFVENIRQTNMEGGGARPPLDPLIEYGYIESYPQNPFCRDSKRLSELFKKTGGEISEAGSVDVRFGHDGMVMGNIVDDPRFLWDVYPVFNQPDKIRLQPTRLVNTFSPKAYKRNVGSVHPRQSINPFYAMGGIPKEDSLKKVVAHWFPGQFVYRASGDMILRDDVHPDKLKENGRLSIWDFKVVKFDKYILAAFGDTKNKGLDIIRITTLEHKPINNHSGVITETYVRSGLAAYPEYVSVFMSPPEVFGGGDFNNNPVFPYWLTNPEKSDEKVFLYGAPDGYPDGILEPVLIDKNSQLFF